MGFKMAYTTKNAKGFELFKVDPINMKPFQRKFTYADAVFITKKQHRNDIVSKYIFAQNIHMQYIIPLRNLTENCEESILIKANEFIEKGNIGLAREILDAALKTKQNYEFLFNKAILDSYFGKFGQTLEAMENLFKSNNSKENEYNLIHIIYNILISLLRLRKYDQIASKEFLVYEISWETDPTLKEKAIDMISFSKARAATFDKPPNLNLMPMDRKNTDSFKSIKDSKSIIKISPVNKPRLEKIKSEMRLMIMSPKSKRIIRHNSISKIDVISFIKIKPRLSKSLTPLQNLLNESKISRKNSDSTLKKAFNEQNSKIHEISISDLLHNFTRQNIMKYRQIEYKKEFLAYYELINEIEQYIQEKGIRPIETHKRFVTRVIQKIPTIVKNEQNQKEKIIEKCKKLLKKGVSHIDLMNELSPKKEVQIFEERHSFEEKTQEFASFLFDYQQRNFIMNPFDEILLKLDLISDFMPVKQYMQSLGRATNFIISPDELPEYMNYQQEITNSAANLGQLENIKNLPIEFLKNENAKIMLLSTVIQLIKNRFIQPDKNIKPIAYSYEIIRILRNEFIKKVFFKM